MENFEGVIIKNRETLRLLIEKAGCDTLDDLYKDEDFDVNEALIVAHALGIISLRIEHYIMPKGIEKDVQQKK